MKKRPGDAAAAGCCCMLYVMYLCRVVFRGCQLQHTSSIFFVLLLVCEPAAAETNTMNPSNVFWCDV
jgi:hypothetical protein